MATPEPLKRIWSVSHSMLLKNRQGRPRTIGNSDRYYNDDPWSADLQIPNAEGSNLSCELTIACTFKNGE